MSKISVRQAAWLTGKSRETINTATKQGTISFSLNSRNQKEIDVAELERVYPLIRSMNNLEPEVSGDVSERPVPDGGPSDLRQELAVLRERVLGLTTERDMVKSERERERRQLEAEIEHLRDSLKAEQENQSKAMLLLTHERSAKPGQGPDEIAAIVETMELLKKQNRVIVRELRQKKQGFWKRVFGGGQPPAAEQKSRA